MLTLFTAVTAATAAPYIWTRSKPDHSASISPATQWLPALSSTSSGSFERHDAEILPRIESHCCSSSSIWTSSKMDDVQTIDCGLEGDTSTTAATKTIMSDLHTTSAGDTEGDEGLAPVASDVDTTERVPGTFRARKKKPPTSNNLDQVQNKPKGPSAKELASKATGMMQFFTMLMWTCLCDTPFGKKNPRFAQFITSLAVLQGIATAAGLVFAPGLLDVVQSIAPPTLAFFEGLPTSFAERWAIYAISLRKPGCRPLLYFGSGTSAELGVKGRLKQYDDGYLIPTYVQHALDDGYVITHKGLLCWIPSPDAASAPVSRLLIVLAETTLSYLF